MKNGYRVIDADAHIQDELAGWVDYVEPAYWDRRPRIEVVEDGQYGWGRRYARILPCELFPQPREAATGLQRRSASGRKVTSPREFMPEKYGDSYHREWTAESRLEDMDRYGWDKQVMITGIGGLGWSWSRVESKDQGLLWAMARAWHNWCHDFASADPTRLYPVVEVPNQHDIEGMVEESRRAVEKLGAVTVMMPKPSTGRPWEDPSYVPFWSLAEELDFPVSFHGVNSGEPHTAARYQPRDLVPGQQTGPGARLPLSLREHALPGPPHLHGGAGTVPQVAGGLHGGQRGVASLVALSPGRPRPGVAPAGDVVRRAASLAEPQRLLSPPGLRGLRRRRRRPGRGHAPGLGGPTWSGTPTTPTPTRRTRTRRWTAS